MSPAVRSVGEMLTLFVMEKKETPKTLPPTVGQEATGWFARNRAALILVVILAAGNIGTWLYQNHKQGKQKETYEEALVERGQEMAELVAYRNEQQLNAVGKALGNSVRAEMIRGNKEQLNQFLIEMVQQTEVELVMVVDSVGNVYLSTDKKYENQFILDVIPTVPRVVDKPMVVEASAKEALYAAPINSLNHQIATMVVTYAVSRRTNETLQRVTNMKLIESGNSEGAETE